MIDGETEPRRGTVRLVREASARLGKPDLAASAKGHSKETGQVLVSISRTDHASDSCPIGKAAWADFPDVTLLDVLRTRLRF